MSQGDLPIAPPATIGMLGGGQLGRYAIVAARLAGYRTVVLDPDPAAPAGAVADVHLVAAYDDAAALDECARRCAVVTTEFENPPAQALHRLARDVIVAPPARAVAIAQDRIAEKSFLARAGVAVAPCAALIDVSDLDAAIALGGPAIVKTARFGYDGKGQRSVSDARELEAAWDEFDRVPCIVERRLPLDLEISVVVARRRDGVTSTYPVAENVHRDGILDLTLVPARIDHHMADDARELGTRIATALDFVGVLAIEMFISGGRLVVNELAPRPHNSAHWTLDASHTSQFAQQIRAVTGTALGATSMTAPAAAMVNLLGELWFTKDSRQVVEPHWSEVLGDADSRLHLYGKSMPRPGRKMGHLTVIGDEVDEIAARALRLREAVRRKTDLAPTPARGDDGRMQQPPERLDVSPPGIALRRPTAADVDALHAVIESSRAHLRPFMPWADQDRDGTAGFVTKAAENWASGTDHSYLVIEQHPPGGDERILGVCGLHHRSDDRGTVEIGYWLRPEAVGRGVMTAATRALTDLAFTLTGISRVTIRCDAANQRSAAIPRRLGFVHVRDEAYEPVAAGQTGRHQVWMCDHRSGSVNAPGSP